VRVAAIIPAAGRGERLQSRQPKPFVRVGGKPLLVHALLTLIKAFDFEEVVVLADKRQFSRMRRMLSRHRMLKSVRVEFGGLTRADSVKRGLCSLTTGAEWVLVHDAARPLVSVAVIRRTLEAARQSGAALCAMPVTSTVKRLRSARNVVLSTEDRGSLCLAQTPQVFRRELLLSRYKRLGCRAMSATDEAALFDGVHKVAIRVVPGEARNMKVTTKQDLKLVEYYLSRSFS
jgi:2-C-methyl-D-erythritol 4-phosphate cytidylyltransferase